MSAIRPQFSIDDAFELILENVGPGPESSGVPPASGRCTSNAGPSLRWLMKTSSPD